MAMPMERAIQIYLLREIEARGGSVPARDSGIYETVARHFPLLTQEDLDHTNESGENTWRNRVDWTRNALADRGEIDRSTWGVWPITQKGRDRLQAEWPPKEPARYSEDSYVATPVNRTGRSVTTPMPQPNGVAPVSPLEPTATEISPRPSAAPSSEPAERQAREAILQKLNEMDDSQFEQFVRRFFAKLGHENLNVEALPEGTGVDAECVLEEPFIGPPVTVVWRVAQGTVELGASAVRDFRAAWEDKADRLVLISPGGFARDAGQVATAYRGSKAVGLISGKELTDLMILKEIGVTKQTVVVYDLDKQFWGRS
jgi:restriction endonuclease Mrr